MTLKTDWITDETVTPAYMNQVGEEVNKNTDTLKSKSNTNHKHKKSEITDFEHEHTMSDIKDFEANASNINFDKNGTDLKSVTVQDAVKEVNAKANANKELILSVQAELGTNKATLIDNISYVFNSY